MMLSIMSTQTLFPKFKVDSIFQKYFHKYLWKYFYFSTASKIKYCQLFCVFMPLRRCVSA